MDNASSFSPAIYWFTLPLQFAEIAANAIQALASPRIAPEYLSQAINPGWSSVINLNSNNSSAPETERMVLMRHSYGRQLGRLMDVVEVLIEDLELRQPSLSKDDRLAGFQDLKADIDDIKAKAAERRLETIAADLKLLRSTDEVAYRNLKGRLRDLAQE